jgi:hypothetical protein
MKALALLLCLILAAPAAAAPLESVPGSGALTFGIWRGGKRIGTHSYAFRRAGDDLIVEQHVDLTVRAGFVTLYRYTAKRLEVWRDGHVVQYDSDTNDDGSRRIVHGRATPAGLVLQGTAGARDLQPDAAPFGLWNRAAIEHVPLFNAEDGKPMKVNVRAVDGDLLTRYRVTGEVNYVLSYVDDVLRGVKIAAPDGSTVEYLPE